jgi:hypothetical protein
LTTPGARSTDSFHTGDGGTGVGGTVQIQDDAHVVNVTVVQNDAATLPVGVYIWATTQDVDSKSVFDTDVRNKVNTTFPIVIGINTQSHHESIQVGSQAGLSQRAALMQRVPAQPAGFGVGLLLFIVLIVGVIAAVVIMARRRRRSSFGAGPSTVAGRPPMGAYPDYGPSYGGPSYGAPVTAPGWVQGPRVLLVRWVAGCSAMSWARCTVRSSSSANWRVRE